MGRRDIDEFLTSKCSQKERCQLGMTTISTERLVGFMVAKRWPYLRSLNAVLVTKQILVSKRSIHIVLMMEFGLCRIVKLKERGVLQFLARLFYPRDSAACKTFG